MGSTSSRQGSSPPTPSRRTQAPKRTLSSIFICGSSSSTSPPEMEEEGLEEEGCDLDNIAKFHSPEKEIALPSIGPEGGNEESSVLANENRSPEDGVVNIATISNEDEEILESEGVTQLAIEDLLAAENEIPEREVTDSGSGDETTEETTPSILGLIEPEGERERRDEATRRDDETGAREARFNARRLIWDMVLMQRGSTLDGQQNFTFPADRSDNSGGRPLGSRSHNIAASLRQRSSSEIWESIRRGSEGYHRDRGICPSGNHAYGTCSCQEDLMGEDGGPRPSVSRIVMLAETLFEVLDEIRRQPVPAFFSVDPRPAPGSVVDSLPVKIHKGKHESGNNAEPCSICLAEYEEGDEIRVLPCRHEFHMSCVDEWLKENQRVCPVCRRDVCRGKAAAPGPNPETPPA